MVIYFFIIVNVILILSNHLLGKKLKFNMILNKRLEATNIELDIEKSLSAFDILDAGIAGNRMI